MKKIVVIGSKGKVGSVISAGLQESYELVGLDLPEYDISDYETLKQSCDSADTIIYAAHSNKVPELRENNRSGVVDPENIHLEMNVFDVVSELGIPRLVMMSSVHADNFEEYQGSELLKCPGSYAPTSPYGVHKLVLEEQGKHFSASEGYEFIAIRLGGVTRDNAVKTYDKEKEVWLSHTDLQRCIGMCLADDTVPGRSTVFYAVSDNDGRLHDVSNPFGWLPQDNSADYV